jgi:hypothetical protein
MFRFVKAASSLLALTAIVVAGARPAAVCAATYDFEGTSTTSPPPTGALTSLMLTDSGVTLNLTRPGSKFDIINLVPFGAPGFGSRSLDPFWDFASNTPFIGDFSTPLSSVSIDMGDFGQDADNLLLEAYSGLGATGTLLGTATDTLPAGGFTFGSKTLTVSAPGIVSMRFIGGNNDYPNSVYYDNIKATPVPEPCSLALLGMGGLPLLRRLRRRQPAA